MANGNVQPVTVTQCEQHRVVLRGEITREIDHKCRVGEKEDDQIWSELKSIARKQEEFSKTVIRVVLAILCAVIVELVVLLVLSWRAW